MRPPAPPRPLRDLPPPAGVTLLPDGSGADVSIFADDAEAVEVCLFETGDDSGESERRVALSERAHGFWFGRLPGVGEGQRYGVRVHGPWDPERGWRHNPAKLLLDPYARGIEGRVTWRPEVFGHSVGPTLVGDARLRDERDSAPYVPRGVVLGDGFDWAGDRPLHHPLTDSVLYETHVRNLTRRLPGVPAHLRGTYAGLAHEATLEHLTRLGVTAVELLPVHAFTSEPALVQRGLTNHWGYNTLGFFAPHAGYAHASDPQGVLDEVKTMVRELHRAGVEVILDVVYNHTAELGGHDGPTLAWRGLDARTYYRLDERGHDIDVTGCGNTLDLRHPVVARMVLDSLRYWVQEVHVDGFRFDLAVALARGRNDDYDMDHPFLVALRTDPVLSRVKNVAEPWDVGMHGWRTGQFPPPFSEWNDRYRDTVRSFWLTDVAAQAHAGHGVQDLATRLAGSQDLFGARDRGPIASVNYVTAHDGFTAHDLVAYDHKHNGPNGEGNRDGSGHNLSWNHGVEGPTRDEEVLTRRRRSLRNLLGTLLVSTGVPMLNAGDELGRTQRGNNNAYCQDNEISWFDWELAPWQEDLLATTGFLTRLRREHRVLRQRTFFQGRPVADDGAQDVAWYGADGSAMTDGAWGDPGTRTLQLLLDGTWLGEESVLLVLHGGAQDTTLTLPRPPAGASYRLVWDSAWERPGDPQDVAADLREQVTATSLRVYLTAR
ncbi:glycogen debranching protein GlgX [Lapillicoccus jejuensis]|uniref:Glycogen operon protein n=1 Tax=Lapillicoccus jejuensis TaxID=402171 RepID=A0A542E2W0_9MICO|nr:glycogen debranching protein GlgX [Lapillicoccus jejuensis]TQJ09667.1 glycogen operon protein [Lapillicoccus jejuensis]